MDDTNRQEPPEKARDILDDWLDFRDGIATIEAENRVRAEMADPNSKLRQILKGIANRWKKGASNHDGSTHLLTPRFNESPEQRDSPMRALLNYVSAQVESGKFSAGDMRAIEHAALIPRADGYSPQQAVTSAIMRVINKLLELHPEIAELEIARDRDVPSSSQSR